MKKNEIYKFDFLLISVITLIVFIGILTIYSAGFDPILKLNNGMYKRQIIWFLIGFILMIITTFVNFNLIGQLSLHIYAFLLFILILTTFFSTPIRNTRAWITFGSFSIQPSEFMKLATVIILAKYLEIREREIKNFKELLIPSLLVLIPVLFIAKQPDFGTAMIFVPVLFTMLFVGGADISYLISIVSIAAIGLILPVFIIYKESLHFVASNNFIGRLFDYLFKFIIKNLNSGSLFYSISAILFLVGILAYIFHIFFYRKIYRKIYIPSLVVSFGLFLALIVKRVLIVYQYQKDRIRVFFDPNLDPHGSGYNVIQSKIAIGSGGFFGKGFLAGSQSQLGFLPEKTSDFIFSVVAEEWGFLGAFVLVVLLFLVVIRGIQIAIDTKDKFAALLATGIVSIFFYHILINIGMVIGIMPVTGLPLCFVSYGGSNIAMCMVAVGILINIRMKKFVN